MSRLPLWLCVVVATAAPSSALAWSPLRAENPNVKEGNARMAKEEYPAALESYDAAARELPAERGVQLNRGLALLAQDLTEQSKEAFLAAADPSAPPEVRADAYYDLGIAYAREGDALAEQESHEEASAHFREAADAFKRSLRVQPGNRDAAWNLEYALQRIREQEQKQQEQEQQQEPQDQDPQDQQQQDQEQEQKQQEQDPQDQEPQDEGENQDAPPEEPQQGEDEPTPEPEGGEDSEDQEPQPRDQTGQPEESPPQEMAREDVDRFLDALEQNERNLPLERARRRSAGRRPPEKDW